MTRDEQYKAIHNSQAAREWWLSMIKYRRYDWRRDECRRKLRAAIRQAIGLEHEVIVTSGITSMDVLITIDRITQSAGYYF